MQRRNILKPFLHAVVLGLLCTPSLRADFDANMLDPHTQRSYAELYEEATQSGRPLLLVFLRTPNCDDRGYWHEKESLLSALAKNPNALDTLHDQPITRLNVFQLKKRNDSFIFKPLFWEECGEMPSELRKMFMEPQVDHIPHDPYESIVGCLIS